MSTSVASSPIASTRLQTTSRRLGGTASGSKPASVQCRISCDAYSGLPAVCARKAVTICFGSEWATARPPDDTKSSSSFPAEPGQAKAARLASIEVGERGAAARRTRARRGRDYSGRAAPGAPASASREVTEQQERRRLGPLQVVEHQHQGSDSRDPTQQVARRFEREKTLGCVVGLSGCRRRRYPFRQRRADAKQLTAVPRDVFGHDARGRVLDARGEDAPERLQRCPGLVATPVRNRRAP